MGEAAAAIERSDVCAVPAAAVVGEAMVALVLADALTEKFGGDSVAELERAMQAWTATVREQFAVSAYVNAPLMIRPILRYGESLLHRSASDVGAVDDGVQQLIDDMIETMYAAPGVGLAATQVGVPLRMFVDRSVRRPPRSRSDRHDQSRVHRARRDAARRGRVPQRAGVQRHGRAAGPGGRSRASIDRVPSRQSKGASCSPGRFSTRWITSTAPSSSIACGASRRI